MQVRVHWLFALLLVVAAAAGYLPETLITVGSLVAHEIAHLAVAWVLGLEVGEVVLTPFGGMARMDSALENDPQAETSVALAGPFQSFLLAGLMLFLSGDQLFDQELVQFCFQANANLAFFNLIPALPLDGGRALRGLLAQRWGYRRVTVWMGRLGRIAGALMVLAALVVLLLYRRVYATPLLGGLFLWMSAGKEVAAATYRSYRQFMSKREQLRRRRILPSEQLVAVADARLSEVLAHLAARRYHTVLVVDGDLHPLGLLHEAELMDAFAEMGPAATLTQILER